MVFTSQQCSFSGRQILPGYGKRLARVDKSLVVFLSRKCASHFLRKWNPRKIAWTVTSRRHRGKDVIVTAKRRVARKAAASTRGYTNIDNAKLESLRKKFALS